jgi:hypothetical protein
MVLVISTMAEEKPKKGSKDDALREHDLVGKIVTEAGQPGNAVMLVGYVGKSGSNDIVRLYLNLNFDEYVDINRADILHAAEAPQDVLTFGGTYIWCKKDAHLNHVYVESNKLQAKFLEGSLSQALTRPSPSQSEDFFASAIPRSFEEVAFCPRPTHPPGCGIRSEEIPCPRPTNPAICGPITVPPRCPRPTNPAICGPITVPPRCPRPTTPAAGCIRSEQLPCPSEDFVRCPRSFQLAAMCPRPMPEEEE